MASSRPTRQGTLASTVGRWTASLLHKPDMAIRRRLCQTRVTSYWVSIQWDAEGDRKFIRAMGSYVDTCVKVDGRWLIKEKIIDPWNSETAPMVGKTL